MLSAYVARNAVRHPGPTAAGWKARRQGASGATPASTYVTRAPEGLEPGTESGKTRATGHACQRSETVGAGEGQTAAMMDNSTRDKWNMSTSNGRGGTSDLFRILTRERSVIPTLR
ncbi:hypothetical protein GCM10009733_073210 [Nonomuraea maheshkhaliensis]|uniref:Uncharacterized protein n=1 Tax=Nonomuraea maheshkhaliensis TaxID=419590 RepID=A0ABN2G4Z1_9ACTN